MLVVVLICSEVAAQTCCYFCLEVVEESSGEKPQLWWGCAGELVAHALGKHRGSE